tara:strand:+ start:62 stop:397 length:336 start_codon:yes stop_codon:yes gene_type:complete
MKLFKYICFFVFYAFNISAYEVLDACAEYKNTGEKYKIEIQIFKGSELNKKTNTFNYNSFSRYGVIFWSNDQATIIEFDYFLGSFPTLYGVNGKDQRGYPWEVRSGHNFCY